MVFDRDETLISDALNALDLEIKTPDLLQGIRYKMQSADTSKRRRKALRPVIVAALIASLLGITALAVSLGGLDWLMGKTEVPFGSVVDADYLSEVSDGIRISIIAKKSYGDMSVLYVTLKDELGLGRVDESSQISLKTNSMVQSWFYKPPYFDSESGIAAYEVRLGAKDSFDGQTLMLTIDGLSYGRRDVGEIQVDIDLAEALANGENIGEPYKDKTRAPSEFLIAGYLADIEGTNSAWVSSIGVLNGYLTVQTGQPAGLNMSDYNNLWPILRDADGNVVEHKGFGSGFSTGGDMLRPADGLLTQAAYTFSEHYFDVDLDDLEGYTLCFEGWMLELVKGDWTFEIDFDSLTEAIEIKTDIEAGGVTMTDLTLTLHPLGMTIRGDGVPGEYGYSGFSLMGDVVLETTGGDIKLGCHSWGLASPETDSQEFECVWLAESAIDMDSVTAIRIGDNRITIR